MDGQLKQGDKNNIIEASRKLVEQMRYDVDEIVADLLAEKAKIELWVFEGNTPEKIFHSAMEYFRKKKDFHGFCLVVLPDRREHANTIYSLFKKLGDIIWGFHTVSVTKRVLLTSKEGIIRSIRTNLSLKFNLKAGGKNHIAKSYGTDNGLPLISEGDTMVVGYDVSHPTGVGFFKKATTKGSQDKEGKTQDKSLPPSFVGLVASIDKHLNNWPAVAWENEARVEILHPEALERNFKSRLELWKNTNKELPKQIIVYRDGVSEGQYKEVLEKEVKAIREACASLCKEPKNEAVPKLLFIVTVKRHQTRFYHIEENRKDSDGNPKNGLVVDNGVTVSRHWDFFLQPHTAIKGKKISKGSLWISTD